MDLAYRFHSHTGDSISLYMYILFGAIATFSASKPNTEYNGNSQNLIYTKYNKIVCVVEV